MEKVYLYFKNLSKYKINSQKLPKSTRICQSGKISPNLVTLVSSVKCFKEATQVKLIEK